MDMDTVFLKKNIWHHKLHIYNVFDRYFYLSGIVSKGALAAIHFSDTIIISGGQLPWSSIFKGTVFF